MLAAELKNNELQICPSYKLHFEQVRIHFLSGSQFKIFDELQVTYLDFQVTIIFFLGVTDYWS